MSFAETEMGIGPGGFPTTQWSVILGAADAAAPEARQKLERLLTRYWRPIYQFTRFRGFSVEDAKDLTQEFLAHLLTRDAFRKAGPEKGKFRNFMRVSLVYFLQEYRRDQGRQKRGGKTPILSLDQMRETQGLEPEAAANPEEAFDRAWGRAVLTRALELLGERLTRDGRTLPLKLLERYDLPADPAARPSYQELAREFGIKESDVGNHLYAARHVFRQCVIDVIAEYAQSPEEVTEEMNALLGGPA